MSPEFALPAWLATYLVHSTIFLAAAAVLTCRRLGLGPGWRETIWRTALLGGILTATAQVAVAPSPWVIEVSPPAAMIKIETTERTGAAPTAAVETASAPGTLGPVASAPATERLPSAGAAPETSLRLPSNCGPILDVVFLVAIGFTLIAAVRVVRARVALRRRLARRERVPDGPWRDALDDLVRRFGRGRTVRVTSTSGLGSPLAMGILRPEICVPRRALTELTPEERDALLAHEMAHVVRRDALRLVLQRVVETVLAIQPLNRLAGRRMREAAELRCDAMAAGWTGRPQALAGCLTRVAGWVLSAREQAWLPAMASRDRLLRRRVRRLMDPPARTDSPVARLVGCAALLALAILGVLVPPVAASRVPRRPSIPEVVTPHAASSEAEATARLRVELDGLGADMAALRRALTHVRTDPELRKRTDRLLSRWSTLRQRAATVSRRNEEDPR